MQDLAYNLLSEQNGAVVAIDSFTGEILAMCSSPSFDPNKFTQGISTNYWKRIIENPHQPMINKAISQRYPPGSSFKVIVAMAAMAAGVDPNATVRCSGYIYVGNHKFHCAKHNGGHGDLNLADAIKFSCNVYFYHMGKKIGFDKIAEIAKMFGISEKFNLGLVGEITGFLPSRAWKKQRFKQDWVLGDTINCSIGHGFLNVTIFELAVMAARIATRKKVIPTLKSVAEPVEFEDLPLSEEIFDYIQKGMYLCVNKEGGTLFRHRIIDPRMMFAGKTGTSQVVSIKHDEKGNALNDNATWETSHHGISIGFGPVHEPRFAVAALVEHGKSGSRAAAPILKEIMQKVQEIYSSSS